MNECLDLALIRQIIVCMKAIMARSSIIVIAASAGGVSALRFLAAALPLTMPAPVLVVLHIGAHRSYLSEILSAAGRLPAKHGDDGETIRAGRIYIAPPDHHMIVADGRLLLSRGPKVNWARPAIDPLFRSAAESHGPGVAGVVLTGNLNDGTLGLVEIKRRGGVAVVQDPDEAAIPDMPRSAATHVAVDHCVQLAEIPKLLLELTGGKTGKEVPMPTTPSDAEREAGKTSAREFVRPAALNCPDCGGALQRSDIGSMIKFGCHIGHSYTAEVMAAAQFDDMEKSMHAAVRVLNERAEFCRQMAEHTQFTEAHLSADWRAAREQALDRAYKLRDLIEQDWMMPEAPARPTPPEKSSGPAEQ